MTLTGRLIAEPEQPLINFSSAGVASAGDVNSLPTEAACHKKVTQSTQQI